MKLKRYMDGAVTTREPMPLVDLSRSVHAPRVKSGEVLAFTVPLTHTKHYPFMPSQATARKVAPVVTELLRALLVAALFTALMAGIVALKFFFWAPFFLR